MFAGVIIVFLLFLGALGLDKLQRMFDEEDKKGDDDK